MLFNGYKGNENKDLLGDVQDGSSSENDGDIVGDSRGTAIT